jgi:hypothetical protein
MEKQRRFEKKVRAAIFYFYFHTNGSVFLWGRSGIEAHHRASERN